MLSILAVAADGRWRVVAGSLLTCPYSLATTSWRRWHQLQPRTRPRRSLDDGPDFGPVFCIEPSPGVRAARAIIACDDWQDSVEAVRRGNVNALGTRYAITTDAWTSSVFLSGDGASPAHEVVKAARRPITGIVARVAGSEMPPASPFLELASPPHLPRGADLGAMFRHRHLVHWPEELIGVRWVIAPKGDEKFDPPRRFVIGRLHDDAWIADARPDHGSGHVNITLAWNEQTIDPLGCSLLVQTGRDGLPFLTRQIRISDLPAHEQLVDAWRKRWNERVLTISVPRGPRRSDWGAALLAPDGRLLDEWPVATRAERIEITINIAGSSPPGHTSVVGDPHTPPTVGQIDEAVEQAIALEAQAREAAARRRFSTAGEMERYLRGRLGCRAGEVLILDPSLLRGSEDDVTPAIAFLTSLGRPIRALCVSVSSVAAPLLSQHAQLDVRRLPDGADSLHDRIWLVGETGLAVGASPSGFLPRVSRTRRASTATELPHADALLWRKQFEAWWRQTGRASR